MTDTDRTPRLALPEAARRLVVRLAADALGAAPSAEVPLPLRPYARFTPNRRARFAADALASVLESDPGFRQRAAERFRDQHAALADELDAHRQPAAVDPDLLAAAGYLLRPPGWEELVERAARRAQAEAAERAEAEADRLAARLRSEREHSVAASRAEADKLRGELDALRREAEGLRRRLRSAESETRRAEAGRRAAERELAEHRAESERATAASDAELRRLRSRLTAAQRAAEAGRRAERSGRSEGDLRLRLLLDTVVDAAQGLRRELALPPALGRPADAVEARTPRGATPHEVPRRALPEDDPALLDELLALPQAHLVVDGYNVTKTGYPSLALREQRLRLVGGLAGLAAQTRAEVTCVFDGADLDAPVIQATPKSVRVLFSRAGETADELIRRLVRAEPRGRPVVVVSADREVADGVRRAGALPVSSTLLLRRLGRV